MTNVQHKTEELGNKLSQLNGHKVIIVGDICLDEYVRGDVSRISPEAPVPVVAVSSTETRLGLSANVAQNIKSLGGEPLLVGLMGSDEGAIKLKNHFKSHEISSEYLVEDTTRPTILKTRFMNGNHHLLRVDHEKRKYISSDIEAKILQKIESAIGAASAIVIQDYAKGTITKSLSQSIVALGKKHNVKVLADPHRQAPLEFYKGVDLLKPNQEEAFILSGITKDSLQGDETVIDKVAEKLQSVTQAKELIITMGSKGMRLYRKDGIKMLPTFAKEVFDVTGAGDTVIAALSLAWASGLSLEDSGYIANLAAGVVVGKVGCVPCSQADILESL